MTDLVTITCNIERHLMILQAESVMNFVEPCTHWVVVNEKNVDVHAWHDILKPYYKYHKLYVIPRRFLLSNASADELPGHATQQVLKMMVAKLVQKDYLLLDAKNFFVQPFKMNQFDDFIGSGYLESMQKESEDDVEPAEKEDFVVKPLHSKYWQGSIDVYMNKLGITEVPKYYLGPRTPFKIDYDLLIERINLDTFFEDLLYYAKDQTITNPSEFLYYSLAVNDKIVPGTNTQNLEQPSISHTYFFENFNDDAPMIADASVFEDEDSIMNTDQISIFGFHRKFLELCGPEHIMQINRYLMNKGFKFRFM